MKSIAMVAQDVEEKIARVSDILEQIESLNQVLEFQQANDGDASTIRQYEYMRQGFIDELSELLKEFKLQVQGMNIAA